MNITLHKLRIENFKGIKAWEPDFDGESAIITAENGIGKTTVFDAFLWLLFGKASDGRKDFELRPLDAENRPLKGLVLCVEGELDFDGKRHTFKKEHRENIVKKQLRGYETECWIDEVPKKVGEYAKYIAELIPEDTFKLLTDLSFFCEKMHWTKRRTVLLELAGEIDKPKGFADLLVALGDRTLDEYKSVLQEQKKRYTKEREEINPRIDEIQRGLDEYAGTDQSELEAQREAVQGELKGLEAKRKELLGQEKIRQIAIERLNGLKVRLAEREGELKSDTGAIQDLIDQKAGLQRLRAEKEQALRELQNSKAAQSMAIRIKETELQAAMAELEGLRKECKLLNDTPTEIKEICYACGQKLPQAKIEEVRKAAQAKLGEVNAEGQAAKAVVDAQKAKIAEAEQGLRILSENIEKAEAEAKACEETTNAEIAKIDEQVKNNPKPDPKQDATWQRIAEQIEKVEKDIGEPVSEQMNAIEAERDIKQIELTAINNTLAQADRMKKDAERIKELEDNERQLSQILAGLDEQLVEIDQYKAAESAAIECAVNGKFKAVEFKLFKQLLNGGLEDCCEAMYQGVPYKDMSTGQKIYAGVDIVNVLSEHYGLSVPLFVDHAESLTMPLEANSQTIELYAAKGVTKLTIEKKGELANV